MSESTVEIADDYTKRKNVFRLKTEAGSEVLFQADNDRELTQWFHAVEVALNAKDRSGSQRKLTSATSNRNRSPTGQSPASKNRKASAGKFFFLVNTCSQIANIVNYRDLNLAMFLNQKF